MMPNKVIISFQLGLCGLLPRCTRESFCGLLRASVDHLSTPVSLTHLRRRGCHSALACSRDCEAPASALELRPKNPMVCWKTFSSI